MKNIATLLVFSLLSQFGFAQSESNYLNSIEGVTNKMLDIISGDIDEERDWDSYRNLFLPTAQKISIQIQKDGNVKVRSMNLEEFIRYVGPLYSRDGFEEYSTGVTINEFNGIANVFQSFYCKNLLGTYEQTGINSYQMVFKDDRWWIASTLFTNATKENPVPDKYLKSK